MTRAPQSAGPPWPPLALQLCRHHFASRQEGNGEMVEHHVPLLCFGAKSVKFGATKFLRTGFLLGAVWDWSSGVGLAWGRPGSGCPALSWACGAGPQKLLCHVRSVILSPGGSWGDTGTAASAGQGSCQCWLSKRLLGRHKVKTLTR